MRGRAVNFVVSQSSSQSRPHVFKLCIWNNLGKLLSVHFVTFRAGKTLSEVKYECFNDNEKQKLPLFSKMFMFKSISYLN